MEPKKPDAPDANLARDMLAELLGIVRTPETVQREVRELEIAQARQRLRDAVQSVMYQVKFYGVGRLGMDSPDQVDTVETVFRARGWQTSRDVSSENGSVALEVWAPAEGVQVPAVESPSDPLAEAVEGPDGVLRAKEAHVAKRLLGEAKRMQGVLVEGERVSYSEDFPLEAAERLAGVFRAKGWNATVQRGSVGFGRVQLSTPEVATESAPAQGRGCASR
jgi:hypothetical protein